MDHVVTMGFQVTVHFPSSVEAPEEPTIQPNVVGIHVDRQELREVRGTRSSDGGQGPSRGRGLVVRSKETLILSSLGGYLCGEEWLPHSRSHLVQEWSALARGGEP